MTLLVYALSGFLGLLGLIFLVAAGQTNTWPRLVIGIVCIGAAIALAVLTKLRPVKTTIVQKIDLSGDVHAEGLQCKQCGGTLGEKSISVRAGGVFIQCEYCGATYQLEEEAKW